MLTYYTYALSHCIYEFFQVVDSWSKAVIDEILLIPPPSSINRPYPTQISQSEMVKQSEVIVNISRELPLTLLWWNNAHLGGRHRTLCLGAVVAASDPLPVRINCHYAARGAIASS